MLLLTLLFTVILAAAMPTINHALSSPDIDTLHLALYLENLEYALFTKGCSDFGDADFANAGFAEGFRSQVCVVAQQESFHVTAISELLEANGVTAIPACTYDFPYEDVIGFVELASKVTTVGIGAYMGAIKAINDDPTLRETIASILTVEARHDAFLRMGIKRYPFPTTFDTGLTAAWAYNLAQPFIVSCPIDVPSRIRLPSLKLIEPTKGPVAPGTPIKFSWDSSHFLTPIGPDVQLYMAGVAENVTDPIYGKVTRLNANTGTVPSPADVPSGVVYVCLTTFSGGLTMDDLTSFGTLAGPLEIIVS